MPIVLLISKILKVKILFFQLNHSLDRQHLFLISVHVIYYDVLITVFNRYVLFGIFDKMVNLVFNLSIHLVLLYI